MTAEEQFQQLIISGYLY